MVLPFRIARSIATSDVIPPADVMLLILFMVITLFIEQLSALKLAKAKNADDAQRENA